MDALASKDLVTRPWARGLWCGLGVIALAGFFLPGLQTPLWIVSFGVSGTLCMANAVRSGRFHCAYTGPFFLTGALATALRAAGLIAVPSSWIGGAVVLAVGGALAWERWRGTPGPQCCSGKR
jgi:hypothetical protein